MTMRRRALRTAAKRRRKNRNQPTPKAVKARKRARKIRWKKGRLITLGA
jgi:hypothetical protein